MKREVSNTKNRKSIAHKY